MSLLLFYDTETTGLPLWSEPSGGDDQPHIVQLAAALVDEGERRVESMINLVVRPLEWDIPDEVVKIHGIDAEVAYRIGVDEPLVVQTFFELFDRSDVRVAHNERFDARILRIALKRYLPESADAWKAGDAYCTQSRSTPIVKEPPTDAMMAAGRKHHKTASLQDAYKFFTGKTFKNAHNGLADVRACIAVYFGIKDHERKNGT